MEGTWACLNLWQEVRTKRGIVEQRNKSKANYKALDVQNPSKHKL